MLFSASRKVFKPINIGGATAVVSILSLFSYIVGFLRDRILGRAFGLEGVTDAYQKAFIIPDLIFQTLILGLISATFLPLFSDLLRRKKEDALKLANTTLNTVTLLVIILSTLIIIFIEPITNFAFSSVALPERLEIMKMTRLMTLSAVVFGISNILGNVLMGYKHFFAYGASPILYNFGIIAGVLIFKENLGIYGAAIGVLIGAVLHLLIRIWDIWHTDYKFNLTIDLKDPNFLTTLKLMPPKAISLSAWYLNTLVLGNIAQGGDFTAYSYARNIQSAPVSLFGIAFATAVYPYLSQDAGEKNYKSYTQHIQNTIQRILFFAIPSMVGILILSPEIINLLFEGKEFDQQDVLITSTILAFFAFSIPFESLNHLLARSFYALKNTFTPMIVNVISMGILILNSLFIVKKFGVEWFGVAFAGTYLFNVLVFLILLRKKFQNFQTKDFLKSLTKIIIASGGMALAVYLTNFLENSLGIKLATVIRIILGGGTFFILALILKIKEIESVKYIIGRFFRKNKKHNR